ncbi:aldose epimerase family protein [Veillonella sp. R32]|uniref:aldose epimerase family protein n=1 Tax=Veillonella sp. R32 TaxID=2021312 RepID=UPI00138A4BD7|nr:aldose epimerase family protein [Veillonella sp. R32]KAF1682308.1 hypothetical protein VER_06165 [Veillonella sp. R32]
MKRYDWGKTRNGEAVTLYELETEVLTVRILNRGATIVDFIVKPLKRNIVLGYDNLQGYEQGDAYLGATVGRVANRIGGAQCEIAGKTYTWQPNNGPNLLHSGDCSLSFAVWHVVPNSEQTGPNYAKLSLATTLRSIDDGFPGDLRVKLQVELIGAELRLTYQYMTSEDSVVNITGHSYFNLNGSDSLPQMNGPMMDAEQGLITNHELQLEASQYLPFGADQIPTGELASVAGTPFDFRIWQSVGEALCQHHAVLTPYRGYDHHYVLQAPTTLQKAHIDCKEVQSHIDTKKAKANSSLQRCGAFRVEDLTLTVLTDAPGFQLYTGNWLTDEGRNGEVYESYSGICIEPQFAPNDINMPAFQESLTKAQAMYERRIVYVVDVLGNV